MKRLLAGLLGVAALLVAGCSTHSVKSNGAPEPGDLLSSQSVSGSVALPGAASTRLITYMSQGPQGRPVVVSGTVSVPKSAPPKGGWPVISWAHGTTGYADECAPSADFDGGPAHGYLQVADKELDAWVSRGFAVVATDFQGLGTPGGHPYSNGVSEANDVIDIVRAARQLDSSIGTTWVAAGHSQGGQTALFTAVDAARRAPDLQLKGAVALAPGSNFRATVKYVEAGGLGAQAAEPFIPLLVLGAAAADPKIDPDSILTPDMRPALDATRSSCLDQVRAVPPVPTEKVFSRGVDLKPFTDYLARQEPERLAPRVPVFMGQGLADTTVAPAATATIVTNYCAKRVDTAYYTYPGVDHRGLLAASDRDARTFVDDVVAGRPVARRCPSG